MKKLAVLSDTHAQTIAELSPTLIKALSGVDLIIHAGDFIAVKVLTDLRAIAPVRAVCGNMDPHELRELLPETDIFTVENRKIGLIHGWGRPWGLEQKVKSLFENVDMVIYGHSHTPFNEKVDGVLVFNPGTARESFGIVEIDTAITARIVRI